MPRILDRRLDAQARYAQAQDAATRAERRRNEALHRQARCDALIGRLNRRHQSATIRRPPNATPRQRSAPAVAADGKAQSTPPAARTAAQQPAEARKAEQQPTGNIALLSVLPDLGRDLAPQQREAARNALVLPTVTIRAGRCALHTCAETVTTVGRVIGLVVLDGLLLAELDIAQLRAAQIYGPGDLLDGQAPSDDGSVPMTAVVTVPDSATLAILDDRALVAMRRWPRLISGLLTQGFTQATRANAHHAISLLPRAEDRVLATFWHLADRWGRRRGDGIHITLVLTHETIGHLVGARRPTVTLALRALKEQHLLTRQADGSWLLAPESLARFERPDAVAIATAPSAHNSRRARPDPSQRRRPAASS